jgi:hypothetical protein
MTESYPPLTQTRALAAQIEELTLVPDDAVPDALYAVDLMTREVEERLEADPGDEQSLDLLDVLYPVGNALRERQDLIEDSRVEVKPGTYLGIQAETLLSAAEEIRTWHLHYTGSDRAHVLTGVRGNLKRIRDGLCEHVHAASEREQRRKARTAFYRVEELLHDVGELQDKLDTRRRGIARRTSALGRGRLRGARRRGAGRAGHGRRQASRGPPDDDGEPDRRRRCRPGRRRREAPPL